MSKGNFTVIRIVETAGQELIDLPVSQREHYVRATDSQNGKTLWITESYANRASAIRAARRLEERHNGGTAVFVP